MKNYYLRQQEEYDCGATCLESLIKYYGGFVPIEIIKIDTKTNQNGTNFYNIKEAAIKYGFEVIGLKDNFNNIDVPFIIQINNKIGTHFVVVYEINDLYVVCMDPAYGKKNYSINEFAKMATTNILKISPINKIVRYNHQNHFVKIIKEIIISNKKSILILLFASIILIIVNIILTYFTKTLISIVSIKTITTFIILNIIKLAFDYIKNSKIAKLHYKNNIILINEYIKKHFNLPFKFLQLKEKSEIISRIKDLNGFKNIITEEIINVLINSLFCILSIIILCIFNIKATIIIVFISIIIIFFSYFYNKKNSALYYDVISEEDNYLNKALEYTEKIITIKNLNKTEFFYNKLKVLSKQTYYKNYLLDKKLTNYNLIIQIFISISLLIIFTLGINSLGLGNILLYILYYNNYLESLNYFITLIPNLFLYKTIINRINGIYYIDNEVKNNGKIINNNNISIRNLNYEINNQIIINNLNLSIPTHSKILIMGGNGSGKSTLLNILFKNINDYKGEVNIGNVNLTQIDTNDLRNIISYAKQNDNLFNDTIKNNILLDNEYSEEKYNNVCKICKIDTIINKKRLGENTTINNNLSGGEVQKIIIARTLYKPSSIIIFDESFSNIATQDRNSIISNINKFYKDKTIIYVNHFNHLMLYDQIIDLTARKEKNNVK